jgi:prepilin-type N-terminal cleavage/methylation domain-containing protein
MTYKNKQSGFSAVELLITLFIAAAFLIAGYQLFSLVIKDSGEAREQLRAANVAEEYLQRYKSSATIPCTTQNPITNDTTTVFSGLTNTSLTVSLECGPNPAINTMSKITVNLSYGNPQKSVTEATYVTP